jgi:hypothetical protein
MTPKDVREILASAGLSLIATPKRSDTSADEGGSPITSGRCVRSPSTIQTDHYRRGLGSGVVTGVVHKKRPGTVPPVTYCGVALPPAPRGLNLSGSGAAVSCPACLAALDTRADG